MRIVAGRFRGRRLEAPAGRDLRPTSDRVRESVFNILDHGFEVDWEGAAVLDVFAGTGAYGIEALSRGAGHATFLDNSDVALRCVRRNAGNAGAAAAVTALRLDATQLPPPPLAAQAPCPIAFLDPPYGSGLAPAALTGLVARGWIGAGSLCVVEVGARETLAAPEGYTELDARRYGAARVVFLEKG